MKRIYSRIKSAFASEPVESFNLAMSRKITLLQLASACGGYLDKNEKHFSTFVEKSIYDDRDSKILLHFWCPLYWILGKYYIWNMFQRKTTGEEKDVDY